MDESIRASERSGDRERLRTESLRAGITKFAIEDFDALLESAIRSAACGPDKPKKNWAKGVRERSRGSLAVVIDFARTFGCGFWSSRPRKAKKRGTWTVNVLGVAASGRLTLGAKAVLEPAASRRGPFHAWPGLRRGWPLESSGDHREASGFDLFTPVATPVLRDALEEWAAEESPDRFRIDADAAKSVVLAMLDDMRRDGQRVVEPVVQAFALRLSPVR